MDIYLVPLEYLVNLNSHLNFEFEGNIKFITVTFYLLSFQRKFNAYKITITQMALYYCSVCFITMAQGLIVCHKLKLQCSYVSFSFENAIARISIVLQVYNYWRHIISSICHFVYLPFYQLAILWTCLFFWFAMCLLAILSTCNFIRLIFC